MVERPGAGRRRLARLIVAIERRPRAGAVTVAVPTGVIAVSIAGPVAGVIAAVYAAAALTIVIGRRRDAAGTRAADHASDALATLAAELRAGGDPMVVTAMLLPGVRAGGGEGARLADRVSAAIRVTDVTGARLAELLDRLEADARALTRLRATATAQAAGAQATAWLLAALPIAGIALGYGIGADPLRVLLHTRVGGLCAVLALAFQMAGLAWSQRLSRTILDAG